MEKTRKTLVNPNFSAYGKDLTPAEIEERMRNIIIELQNDDLWIVNVADYIGKTYDQTKMKLNRFLEMILLDDRFYMTIPALKKYFRNWAYKADKIKESQHNEGIDKFRHQQLPNKDIGKPTYKEPAIGKGNGNGKVAVDIESDFGKVKSILKHAVKGKLSINDNIDSLIQHLFSIAEPKKVIYVTEVCVGIYMPCDECILPQNFATCIRAIYVQLTETK